MVLLRKNRLNSLISTASQTAELTNPVFLFSFTNIFTKEQKSFIPRLVESNFRYDEFEFTIGPNENLTASTPTVNFTENGQYYYSVYEQTSTTNLNPTFALNKIEEGRADLINPDQTSPYDIYQSPNENNSNFVYYTEIENQTDVVLAFYISATMGTLPNRTLWFNDGRPFVPYTQSDTGNTYTTERMMNLWVDRSNDVTGQTAGDYIQYDEVYLPISGGSQSFVFSIDPTVFQPLGFTQSVGDIRTISFTDFNIYADLNAFKNGEPSLSGETYLPTGNTCGRYVAWTNEVFDTTGGTLQNVRSFSQEFGGQDCNNAGQINPLLPPNINYPSIWAGNSLFAPGVNLQTDVFIQGLPSNVSNFNFSYVGMQPVTPTPTPTITETPTQTPTSTPTNTPTPSSTPLNLFCVGLGFDTDPRTIEYNNGFMYAGGTFEFYQGNRNPLLSKINQTTGAQDPNFYSSIPFTQKNVGLAINDIAHFSNGKMVVGGFYQVGDPYGAGINILNSDGSTDLSFYPSGYSFNVINTIAIDPTESFIYVGGSFSSPANRFAKLSITGVFDGTTFGSGFNSFVNKIIVDTDGSIFVMGGFTSYNGNSARNRVVKLNADGTLNATFDAGIGLGLSAQATDGYLDADGYLYVTGQFLTVNGTSRPRFVRIDKNTGIPDFSWGAGIDPVGSTPTRVLIDKNPITNEFILLYFQGTSTVSYSGTVLNGGIFAVDSNGYLSTTFGDPTNVNYGFSDIQPTDAISPDDIGVNPINGDLHIVGPFNEFSGTYTPRYVVLTKDGVLKSTSFCSSTQLSSTPTPTPTPSPSA